MQARRWIALILLAAPLAALSQTMPALTSTAVPGGGTQWSLSIQTLLLLTSLSFLPAMLLMMTSFTRIIIVMSLLRQAMGTQTAPPNQVIVGLSLFLTFFIMAPVADKIYTEAYLPLAENKISFPEALERGSVPLRTFMIKQTRDAEVTLFTKIAKQPKPESADKLPMRVLIPAFVISELKTAFQIGFIVVSALLRLGRIVPVPAQPQPQLLSFFLTSSLATRPKVPPGKARGIPGKGAPRAEGPRPAVPGDR